MTGGLVRLRVANRAVLQLLERLIASATCFKETLADQTSCDAVEEIIDRLREMQRSARETRSQLES